MGATGARRTTPREDADDAIVPAAPAPGVNVVGYFASELGVGEAARQIVRGLDAVDVPVLPLRGPATPLSRQGHQYAFLDHDAARYPVNLICMNADTLPDFARHAGRRVLRRPLLDRGVVLGGHVAAARRLGRRVLGARRGVGDERVRRRAPCAAVAPIPTTRITVPVEVPEPAPVPRQTFGMGAEEFAFLFSFDYLSVFERKNPLAVVQAFRAAFPRGSGASLTIKTINHEHDPVARARLQATVADDPDIQLIERYLDPELKDALTAACDCYVSLHRAEGFGLTMAEAMYLGKPVIATGYSGSLDFMTPHNSYLVDYRLVAVGDGAAPYPAHAQWAQPSVEDAARLMRHVFEHRAEARAIGRRAAADIRRSHSPRKAGREMRDRLARVHAPGPAPELDALVERLAGRVAAGPQTRPSLPRRLLRDLVLRLMRPFTAHQRDVDDAAVDALRHLAHEVEALRAEQLRAETVRLRQAREAADVRRGPEAAEHMGDPTAGDPAPAIRAWRATPAPAEPSLHGDVLVVPIPEAGMANGNGNGGE